MACHWADPGHQRRAIEVNIGVALSRYRAIGAIGVALSDALVRGIYGSLTMLAQVSSTSDELLGLRDLLFPEGAAHTQKTYRGEAGHAALVAARLDANLQAKRPTIASGRRMSTKADQARPAARG